MKNSETKHGRRVSIALQKRWSWFKAGDLEILRLSWIVASNFGAASLCCNEHWSVSKIGIIFVQSQGSVPTPRSGRCFVH